MIFGGGLRNSAVSANREEYLVADRIVQSHGPKSLLLDAKAVVLDAAMGGGGFRLVSLQPEQGGDDD